MKQKNLMLIFKLHGVRSDTLLENGGSSCSKISVSLNMSASKCLNYG